jgi:hypothetical protein
MLSRNLALASIAFALSMLAATDAVATAQRTFVASYGLTANTAFNCSIVKPCRAFSDAIGVTKPDGEVIVLDSAGYGTFTIAQSVSIIAPPGVYAGITVFSGTGITVSGSDIVVVLRGLTINGASGYDTGIDFAQGAQLTVEDCEIAHLGQAIHIHAADSHVRIHNTVVRDANSEGIYMVGLTVVAMDGLSVADSNVGVHAVEGALGTIVNSHLANNIVGVWVGASSGFYADVMVTHSSITGSNKGFFVEAVGSGVARVVSDGNALNEVHYAFYFHGSGGTEIIYSPGNNTVGFNNGIVIGGSLTPLGTY